MPAWGGFLAALTLLLLMPADARAVKTCNGRLPTVHATHGADVLIGTEGPDVIRGGGGDDRIDARGGNDDICAGPGDDAVDGGAGTDSARLGAGDDAFDGGDGTDYVLGQGGVDFAEGGTGTDACKTESVWTCEADISFSILAAGIPYGTLTGGNDRTYEWPVIVSNRGPSTAPSTYLQVMLPTEAEFVGSRPDGACTEGPVDLVTCPTGALGPGQSTFNGNINDDLRVLLRFPTCPPPGGSDVTVTGQVDDLYTDDQLPANDRLSSVVKVNPDPSCPSS